MLSKLASTFTCYYKHIYFLSNVEPPVDVQVGCRFAFRAQARGSRAGNTGTIGGLIEVPMAYGRLSSI